ncbi:MAG: hypothetical protein JSW65_08535 [Candidatus Bipolaricaulota bacterium]|nr:MAG: hypothetical protein JSW65_08535 [Candidatus Bipolaricaulota bacterium]
MTSEKLETVKAEIETFLRGVLDILEEEAELEIEGDLDDELYVNLTGSLFILSEDRTILAALEHLLRVALRRCVGRECDVILDVNGATKRRRADLVRLALNAAESARREHKRVRLDPMPAGDRRMVHVALATFPGVKTFSTGNGEERRVVIEPDGA